MGPTPRSIACPSWIRPPSSASSTLPFNVGIDGRGETLRLREYGSQLDRQDGYVDLRFSPKSEIHSTVPYIQGGFGIGHTRIPFAANYQNNLAYHVRHRRRQENPQPY